MTSTSAVMRGSPVRNRRLGAEYVPAEASLLEHRREVSEQRDGGGAGRCGAQLLRYLPRTNDPEILAARLQTVQVTLEEYPELDKEVRGKARLEGQLDEARNALRRVLARRGLAMSAEDEARIDGCDELETLERWHDQAITASTATEALR